MSVGELLYSGLATQYVDTSSELEAFTFYEYRVTAVNSRGQTSTQWSPVRTAPSTPRHAPQLTVLVRVLLTTGCLHTELISDSLTTPHPPSSVFQLSLILRQCVN